MPASPGSQVAAPVSSGGATAAGPLTKSGGREGREAPAWKVPASEIPPPMRKRAEGTLLTGMPAMGVATAPHAEVLPPAEIWDFPPSPTRVAARDTILSRSSWLVAMRLALLSLSISSRSSVALPTSWHSASQPSRKLRPSLELAMASLEARDPSGSGRISARRSIAEASAARSISASSSSRSAHNSRNSGKPLSSCSASARTVAQSKR
mmetsp:Transcript_85747/g.255619  ORF Transcript_85747/g.255619 Transcript_85747/m.255619 type:complete len:209 (+) Transcript_85747:537-1163(+)